MTKSARGETGKRKRLKISQEKSFAGSTPAARTNYETTIWCDICGSYDWQDRTVEEHMKLHKRHKNVVASVVIYKGKYRCMKCRDTGMLRDELSGQPLICGCMVK